jgi:hypothetical protein
MEIIRFIRLFGSSRSTKSFSPPTILGRVWWCALVGLACWTGTFRAWSADCVSSPAGLVGWWRGEGNANDVAGANNGVLEGGVAFTAGEVGQAFSCNGVGAGVLVPAASNLHVGAGGGLTIELWINYTWVYGGPLVDWTSTAAYGVHFAVWPSPRALYANLVDINGGSHAIQTGDILTTGTFQHVAVTYDKASGVARLFLNGVIVQASTLGSFTPNTTKDLHIGYRPGQPGGGSWFFKGMIDEVTLYDHALTVAEIVAIYNAGSAGKCHIPLITAQPQSQVGYWGGSVAFNVHAVGSPTLCYQWLKDGTPLNGTSASSLVLTNLQPTDAGNYSVVVTNSLGSTTSSNAYLTVNPSGVSIALYSGITIEGVVGLTYGIQYSTNLSNTNSWKGMANVTLGVPSELWFDVQPANQPLRYYRVVRGPIPNP